MLPFIEEYYSLDRKKYLCCYSSVPVTDIDAIRADMWTGKQVEQCVTCYRLDNNNVISPRLRESFQWIKDPTVNNYLTTWKSGCGSFYFDIRYDNKCNLACITCDALASSLWAKELRIPIRHESKLLVDYDKLRAAKKLYLAGGEPLIIDEFIDLLQFIAANELDIAVVINTNLTVVSDRVLSVLSAIKNCTLVVSVDSFGSVNEYHRWPLKWDKFMTNLQTVRDAEVKLMFNTVIDAISVLNIGELVQLQNFTAHWNLAVLSDPVDLLLCNLPKPYVPQAIAQLDQLATSSFYKSDPKFKSQVDYARRELSKPGDSALLSNYIHNIDKRRNIDHSTYLGITL